MRRVLYSVAASLDGYIAGPAGEFDWISIDPTIDWGAHMGRFDTVLMGRHTFEVAAAHGPGASFPGMRTLVFSRTPRAGGFPGVAEVVGDAVARVARLREEPGKKIWLMGGGILFRSLLEAGLVDEVEVAVVPALLGGGVPLLPPLPRRTRLALTSSVPRASGVVVLNYEIVRDIA